LYINLPCVLEVFKVLYEIALFYFSDVLGTAFKPVKSDIEGNVTVSIYSFLDKIYNYK
jgi:hypothetical protein